MGQKSGFQIRIRVCFLFFKITIDTIRWRAAFLRSLFGDWNSVGYRWGTLSACLFFNAVYTKSIVKHCATKRTKVHVPKMWPIYSGRHGPIEKPYVRRLSRLKRVAEIWGFKVSIFCYLVIIFLCVMYRMKHFEIYTTDKCYQEERLKFFPEFFVHILLQQRSSK